MRKLTIFLSAVLVIACNKDKSASSLHGTWVEKTMRLDTLDFGDNAFLFSDHKIFYLRSNPYWDMYRYNIDGDTIRLNSMNSSYGGLFPYSFKINSTVSFTIGKFYNRAGLPATLEFVKIN